MEYHHYVGALCENDNYFKLFMTGVWNLDLKDSSGDLQRPAGQTPQVYGKNSREQWKYDMHRSLFGALDNSPYTHSDQQSAYRKDQQRQPVTSSMPPAGVGAWAQVGKG